MKLTDKTKAEFEAWYLKDYLPKVAKVLIKGTGIEYFNLLTDSMKYGVFVDYFDSVNIDTDDIYKGEKYTVDTIYQDDENHREMARLRTIEKANELRNEILNK